MMGELGQFCGNKQAANSFGNTLQGFKIFIPFLKPRIYLLIFPSGCFEKPLPNAWLINACAADLVLISFTFTDPAPRFSA